MKAAKIEKWKEGDMSSKLEEKDLRYLLDSIDKIRLVQDLLGTLKIEEIDLIKGKIADELTEVINN